MPLEERGVVVEANARTALVRVRRTPACAGCAAAGHCHGGPGEVEQVLEALNEIGAAAGDAVRVAVPARAVLSASARIYLLPVAGLLAGAAVAQLLAEALLSAGAGETAAGLGGIAGALAGALIGRRQGRRPRDGAGPLARITAVSERPGVDSPPGGG